MHSSVTLLLLLSLGSWKLVFTDHLDCCLMWVHIGVTFECRLYLVQGANKLCGNAMAPQMSPKCQNFFGRKRLALPGKYWRKTVLRSRSLQLPENAIMGFFFPFLRPLHCFVWKCNVSSNVALMSKFCERKRLAGEILEEKYPSNARGTVLAFSVFWALGPFVRVSVRAFGPNLLSKRELWKVSYLKGVHN